MMSHQSKPYLLLSDIQNFGHIIQSSYVLDEKCDSKFILRLLSEPELYVVVHKDTVHFTVPTNQITMKTDDENIIFSYKDQILANFAPLYKSEIMVPLAKLFPTILTITSLSNWTTTDVLTNFGPVTFADLNNEKLFSFVPVHLKTSVQQFQYYLRRQNKFPEFWNLQSNQIVSPLTDDCSHLDYLLYFDPKNQKLYSSLQRLLINSVSNCNKVKFYDASTKTALFSMIIGPEKASFDWFFKHLIQLCPYFVNVKSLWYFGKHNDNNGLWLHSSDELVVFDHICSPLSFELGTSVINIKLSDELQLSRSKKVIILNDNDEPEIYNKVASSQKCVRSVRILTTLSPTQEEWLNLFETPLSVGIQEQRILFSKASDNKESVVGSCHFDVAFFDYLCTFCYVKCEFRVSLPFKIYYKIVDFEMSSDLLYVNNDHPVKHIKLLNGLKMCLSSDEKKRASLISDISPYVNVVKVLVQENSEKHLIPFSFEISKKNDTDELSFTVDGKNFFNSSFIFYYTKSNDNVILILLTDTSKKSIVLKTSNQENQLFFEKIIKPNHYFLTGIDYFHLIKQDLSYEVRFEDQQLSLSRFNSLGIKWAIFEDGRIISHPLLSVLTQLEMVTCPHFVDNTTKTVITKNDTMIMDDYEKLMSKLSDLDIELPDRNKYDLFDFIRYLPMSYHIVLGNQQNETIIHQKNFFIKPVKMGGQSQIYYQIFNADKLVGFINVQIIDDNLDLHKIQHIAQILYISQHRPQNITFDNNTITFTDSTYNQSVTLLKQIPSEMIKLIFDV